MDIKSTQTFDAGQTLVSDGFYTQSIHCFYYSVLQMMKYKLAKCAFIPYDKQDEKKSLYNKSTHDWLLSEIAPRLKGRNRVVFSEDFRLLRKFRVDADYYQRVFNQEESADCSLMAQRLLAKLRDFK